MHPQRDKKLYFLPEILRIILEVVFIKNFLFLLMSTVTSQSLTPLPFHTLHKTQAL